MLLVSCMLGTAWADEGPGMPHAATGAGQTGAEICNSETSDLDARVLTERQAGL